MAAPHVMSGARRLLAAEVGDDLDELGLARIVVLALPIVPNEAYFRVHDAAERITLRFYRICR